MPVQQIKHNNDGKFYHIAIDIAKEGAQLFDLTPYVKGRVGDNNFGLLVDWYRQGMLMNVNGAYKPIIDGSVGNFSFDKNGNLKMNDDASPVSSVGKPEDCGPAGQVTYYFPEQMFPKEGIFKGYLGLIDDKGNRYSGVDIWFSVLAGNARMGIACDFYISELEKAIKEAEDDLLNSKKSMQQVVDDFTAKMNDLTNKLTTQASTDQAALEALEDRIKQDNIVTKPQLDAFEQTMNDKVVKGLDTHGLNIKNYGAVGDGTTDDTGAFRSAIEAARSQVNHHIYIPEGTYLVTDDLVLPDDIGLIGYGAGRETVIKTSGVANLFELGRRNVISNLTLDGTSNGKDITLLKLGNDGRGVSDALVTDVYLNGTPNNKVTGIRSAVYNGQSIFNCTFKNIIAQMVYDGLKFSAAENTWINGNSVTNFTIIGFAHAGIYFTSMDDASLEIAQNHFVNVQIEAIPDAEGKYFDSGNAAAVWLEWGDRNRFDMLHVWNDDSGKVTQSIRLTPGPHTHNLNNYRDNVFNGFAETIFYTNAYTARFNDLTKMQIESNAPFGYAQYDVNLRKFKLDDVRNLISDDLIANAVIDHTVPLFVSAGGSMSASYDTYGPFLSLEPGSGELFVPLQGNDSGYISGMSEFTIGFDVSFDTAEDPNKVKLTAEFANFNADAQRMDVKPVKRNIAIDQSGYSYRITSTFENTDVSAYNVHALNLKWDGIGEGHIRVRRIFIVPGEVDATHDIKLGRAATRWNVKADSQKLSSFRNIGIFTLPDAFVANQMQFNKNYLTGQVDNGTFYGTYPFWY